MMNKTFKPKTVSIYVNTTVAISPCKVGLGIVQNELKWRSYVIELEKVLLLLSCGWFALDRSVVVNNY